MDKKVFYFDLETTGIDPRKHGIIQMAYIVEVNGKIKEEGNMLIRTFPGDHIDNEALKINGRTHDEIGGFMPPKEAYDNIAKVFGAFIDKFNKFDKFYPAGYNVGFDLDFLSEFFKKSGNKYFGSFINWKRIDPLPVLYYKDFKGELQLPNYKLATVCEHYGIPLVAHDALSDIRATRELIKKVYE